MFNISLSNCIRCSFSYDSETKSGTETNKLEVFYAENKGLNHLFPALTNHITNDEQLRADKFHFDADRQTYISCHALLRLILAERMHVDPLSISFIKGKNDKPGLPGNPFFFNISHTKKAFAIAIARDFHVGIDLEEINPGIDLQHIINAYFSIKERDYILKSEKGKEERFFLLWTRKESLLKALGIGITDNLTLVEVCEHENYIDRKMFYNTGFECTFHDHYLYSKKLRNYYLSIAIPEKASIDFTHLNSDNIVSFLD